MLLDEVMHHIVTLLTTATTHARPIKRPEVLESDSEPKRETDLDDVKNLFEDDELEIPEPSSPEGTRPPASESEGFTSDFMETILDESPKAEKRLKRKRAASKTVPSDDDLDLVPSEDIKPQVTAKKVKKTDKKKKKKKGKRDEAFEEEKPAVVRTTAIKPRSHIGTTSSSKTRVVVWPQHAQLVAPEKGTNHNILDQPSLIQKVTRSAIARITDDIVLVRAWPETSARLAYGKPTLLEACRVVANEYPSVQDIIQRINADELFTKYISNMAVDRIALMRSPARVQGDRVVPHYQLGLGSDCRERVQSLFKKHVYVFPGQWIDDGSGNVNTWKPNTKSPYTHPALIDALKQGFFNTSTALGSRYAPRFTTVGQDREMTIPLLALAATGVYFGISRFSDGARNTTIEFSGNYCAAAYEAHTRTLERLKESNPGRFHQVMSIVYTLVAGPVATESHAADDDIFSVIDIE